MDSFVNAKDVSVIVILLAVLAGILYTQVLVPGWIYKKSVSDLDKLDARWRADYEKLEAKYDRLLAIHQKSADVTDKIVNRTLPHSDA